MFIMEGDTPSFLNLVGNGLSVPDRPDWGGWGGRWEQPSPDFGLWADTTDSVAGTDGKTRSGNKETVWRWRKAFQHDFAARMKWSVTPDFGGANHPPQLLINGVSGSAPVQVTMCPGSTATLSSAGSRDPDGQPLTVRWWQYREATGIYPFDLTITAPGDAETTITVPQWEQPADFPLPPTVEMHVIMEVSDVGSPALTRYRRAIVEVPTDGRTVEGKACPKIAIRHLGSYDPSAKPRSILPGAFYSTVESEIGELLDLPAARAVLDRHIPGIAEQASKMALVRAMTLSALRGLDPRITDGTLDAIDAELAAIPAPAD